MILTILIFAVALLVLLQSAGYSIRYASKIAQILRFPEFIISFFIVALISVLPEAMISIISAINGEPSLGFGTLIGSNVADLTLVLGIVTLFSKKNIKVESKILKNNWLYLILLFIPFLLGIDGNFSRIDGIILILFGIIFFFKIYFTSKKFREKKVHHKNWPIIKTLLILVISLILLVISAFITVRYAVNLSEALAIPSIIIGLTVLSIGTCLPELTFSIKSVMKEHDGLALGDILGTVITDATIIFGIVILISPFDYPLKKICLTTLAMFLSGVLVVLFMKSKKVLTKKEGLLLILFYILFIILEILIQ